MVDDRIIHKGNLLFYKNRELCCIIDVNRGKKPTSRTTIIGVNKKYVVHQGFAEDWFYIWDRNSIDLLQ
jgi:hypothetical protein